MVRRKKYKFEFFTFFKNLEKFLKGKSLGANEILKYVAFSALIPAIVLSILFSLNPAYVFTSAHYSFVSAVFKGYVNSLTIFLGIIIFAIIVLYVKSIFLHAFSKILKGKGKFVDTFNVVGISLIPFLLFGWIPVINIWAFFYALTLLIHGLALKQRFTISKSALVLTLSLIVLILAFTSIFPFSLLLLKPQL